jgi:hypothetical protein
MYAPVQFLHTAKISHLRHAVQFFVSFFSVYHPIFGASHWPLSPILGYARELFARKPRTQASFSAGLLFTHRKGLAMARPRQFPKIVGVRLAPEDRLKLQQLCAATQRPASELLRLLVRMAQPTGLAEVKLVTIEGDGED